MNTINGTNIGYLLADTICIYIRIYLHKSICVCFIMLLCGGCGGGTYRQTGEGL